MAAPHLASVSRPLRLRPRANLLRVHQLQQLWPTANSHRSPVAAGILRELGKFGHAGRAVYSAAKKALSRSAYSWTMKVPVLKDLTEVIDSHRRATIIRKRSLNSVPNQRAILYCGELFRSTQGVA